MRCTLILLLLAVALVGACVPASTPSATVAPEPAPRVTLTPRVGQPVPPTGVPAATATAASPGPTGAPPAVSAIAVPGLEPVARNGDWAPVIEEFDGVEMALVPAGCFPMGSTDEQVNDALRQCEQLRGTGACERGWFEQEQPVHTVCFEEPFWIDVYEVTNGQYGSAGTWAGDRLPREGVNWADAAAHCASRGARLPSEAEWEYAARGPDGLVFPWGEGFKGSLLNACDRGCMWNPEGSGVDDGYAETAPVGSYPGGASWVGAMDMSGNVWEWTSSTYEAYGTGGGGEERRVLRGGSWYHTGTDLLRSAARYGVSPEYADYVTGVRCVGSRQ